ncbi:hypothetical protein ACFQ60_29530 [Streptomyces zhihengii]
MWWRVGAAALVWTAALAVPLALGIRAWRVRVPRSERAERGADEGEGAGADAGAAEAGAGGGAPSAVTTLDVFDLEDDFELYDVLPAATWTARTSPTPPAPPRRPRPRPGALRRRRPRRALRPGAARGRRPRGRTAGGLRRRPAAPEPAPS